MMIYPPITELVEKTGSRYSLVIEIAKRARQLAGGREPMVDVATIKEVKDVKSVKDVTVAICEIYEDKVTLK